MWLPVLSDDPRENAQTMDELQTTLGRIATQVKDRLCVRCACAVCAFVLLAIAGTAVFTHYVWTC